MIESRPRVALRQLTCVVLLGLIALIFACPIAFAQDHEVLLVARHSGKCLDVANDSIDDGANVQQYACHDGPNQVWVLRPVGQEMMIVSLKSDKCLDVANASTADQANVQQSACHGNANQRWRLEPFAPGFVRIVSVGSNKCLDIAGGSVDDQANLQQFACHDGDYQLFELRPPSAGFYMLVARHSGKCLDVPDASVRIGDGIQQSDCHAGANQRWQLRTMSDGYFALISRKSGLCLDVAGASPADQADVSQQACHFQPNQQWRFTSDEGGWFRVIARHSNKCLDVAGASIGDGALVQQYQCNGNTNQAWRLTPRIGGSMQNRVAEFLLTGMTIMDDFDGGPSNWGEFCIFVHQGWIPSGRQIMRVFDCTRAFDEGNYSITPADGGRAIIASSTPQTEVTIHLRERDQGWDDDADCTSNILVDLETAQTSSIECPGRNSLTYAVNPLSSQPSGAHTAWLVLSDLAIHKDFDGGVAGNDGEFCIFAAVDGNPVTSAFDCTQAFEEHMQYPIPRDQGVALLVSDRARVTIQVHLRERDSGWDNAADCLDNRDVDLTQGGSFVITCPGGNRLRYLVGPDLNRLLAQRPPTPRANPHEPQIEFRTEPADGRIRPGSTARLIWNVSCPVTCDISLAESPGTTFQRLDASGSQVVMPRGRTRYTLVVDAEGVVSEAIAWIEPVGAPVEVDSYVFQVICRNTLNPRLHSCSTSTQVAASAEDARREVQRLNVNCEVAQISPANEHIACEPYWFKVVCGPNCTTTHSVGTSLTAAQQDVQRFFPGCTVAPIRADDAFGACRQ